MIYKTGALFLALMMVIITLNMGFVACYSTDPDQLDTVLDVYVNSDIGNDYNDGNSTQTPKKTIKSAVEAYINAKDDLDSEDPTKILTNTKDSGKRGVIHLAAGYYSGDGNYGIKLKSSQEDELIFVGEGPGKTVVDASEKSFIDSKSPLEFRDLAVRNAQSKYGAISAPWIKATNCYFLNNKGKYGGALHSKYNCEVKECLFQNNSAKFGGGMYCEGSCNVLLSTFINNTAQKDGGAIHHTSVVLVIDNSCFEGNIAAMHGGAVYTKGSVNNPKMNISTLFTACSFKENKAKHRGGAIYKESCNIDLNVINCDFISNSGEFGGAIYLKRFTLSLYKCICFNPTGSIFKGNHASNAGGAVFSSHVLWNGLVKLAENNTPQNYKL